LRLRAGLDAPGIRGRTWDGDSGGPPGTRLSHIEFFFTVDAAGGVAKNVFTCGR
jgi:hypothetical protein